MERMERRLRRMERMEWRLPSEVDYKGKMPLYILYSHSSKCNGPTGVSFLALYNPQKSNQFIPLSLMLFAVLCCYIHVPVIMPRPICGRAYGEPDYRVLYG